MVIGVGFCVLIVFEMECLYFGDVIQRLVELCRGQFIEILVVFGLFFGQYFIFVGIDSGFGYLCIVGKGSFGFFREGIIVYIRYKKWDVEFQWVCSMLVDCD